MTRLRPLLRSQAARLGLLLLGTLVLLAIVGPLFTRDPSDFIGDPLSPPSREFWLGTTRQGQDVFAQTLAGARTSLGLGFAVGALTVLLGASVGLISGMFRGRVDETLSLLTNIFLILPGLPLSVVLAAYLEASPFAIAGVLTITGWAWNARLVRAQALSLAQKEYVEAAIVAGESRLRVVFAEILPNMLSLLASCFVSAVVHSIAAQVGLEFLGLGDISQVTWGTNLYWAANNQALLTESWWTIVPTGLLIALTGLSLVLINFGIDEVMSPRLRRDPVYTSYLKSHDLSPSFDTPVLRPKGKAAELSGSALRPDAQPLLRVEQLTVDYVSERGQARAVDHLSFHIDQGEKLGLLGESGSGKSTTAMAILRILGAPALITAGEVRYRGQDVLSMSSGDLRDFRFREVSIVLQSALNALCPTLSIGAQVADTLRRDESLDPARSEARVVELLALVGLSPEHRFAFPHQLSGGMRQRVVIALALALRPSLLIMDEPTTALDVVLEREILAEIQRLQGELGFSILFISHDLSLMLDFCDRVGVMYAGKLVELGPAHSLKTDALHPYTRGLLHSFPGLLGPKRRLTGVPGAPPDLQNLPQGCRFLPRCALGDPTCAQKSPELSTYQEHHKAACFKLGSPRSDP